jgi:hypothetical protein
MYHSGTAYGSKEEALKAATVAVVWLDAALKRRPAR